MLEESADSSMDTSSAVQSVFGETSKNNSKRNAGGDGTYPRKKLRSSMAPSERLTSREWIIMYGVDDHMAFYIPIRHPSAYCNEKIGVYTLDERNQWNVGENIAIAWGGKPVNCKIHAFCASEANAKVQTELLSERLAEESMMGKPPTSTLSGGKDDDVGNIDSAGSKEDSDHSSEEQSDEESSDEDVRRSQAKRNASKTRKQNDKRIDVELNRLQIQPRRSPTEGDVYNQLLVLALQQQKLLTEQQQTLDCLVRQVSKLSNGQRRIEKKLGRDESDHGPIGNRSETCSIFTLSDNLIWMGVDVAQFFNDTFDDYDCIVSTYLPNLGILMWGDRISYYYCIPAGKRQKSGSQRRQLLQKKDPSGVECLMREKPHSQHAVVIEAIVTLAFESRRTGRGIRCQQLPLLTAGVRTGLLHDQQNYRQEKMPEVLNKLLTLKKSDTSANESSSSSVANWSNVVSHDRKEVLTQIAQKGLDLQKRRNYIAKAKYYELIENGNCPTADWTVFKEAFDDTIYRNNKADTKETSPIIEVAQKLFDLKQYSEATETLVQATKPLYSFMRL